MTHSLGACPECDSLYRRRPLARGEVALCPVCGARLYRVPRLSPEQALALVVAALVAFLVANLHPIVAVRMQGVFNTATLFGSLLTLWDHGRPTAAGLVLLTAILVPLFDLLAMAALLGVTVRGARRPPWFAPLLRLVLTLRPWGMVEVYMVGMLVALVKLSTYAQIMPGVALWAFAALTVLLAAVMTFDPRALWDGEGAG